MAWEKRSTQDKGGRQGDAGRKQGRTKLRLVCDLLSGSSNPLAESRRSRTSRGKVVLGPGPLIKIRETRRRMKKAAFGVSRENARGLAEILASRRVSGYSSSQCLLRPFLQVCASRKKSKWRSHFLTKKERERERETHGAQRETGKSGTQKAAEERERRHASGKKAGKNTFGDCFERRAKERRLRWHESNHAGWLMDFLVRSTIVPFEDRPRTKATGEGRFGHDKTWNTADPSYSPISEGPVTCPIATEIFQGEMPSLRISSKRKRELFFLPSLRSPPPVAGSTFWKIHALRRRRKIFRTHHMYVGMHVCMYVCMYVYTCMHRRDFLQSSPSQSHVEFRINSDVPDWKNISISL